MIANKLDVNGISTVIMNYCKALNRKKFNVSIIAGGPIAELYKKECSEYGIEIIELPSRHLEVLAHYYKLFFALNKGKYDIVHVHGNSSMMAVELTLAKLAGIGRLIAHSHNSVCQNVKIHNLLNRYFRSIDKKALACGVLAGDWLYGSNQFEILPNGFHTEEFIFSFEERMRVRKKLQIENSFVIGHVGRFNQQKNQRFLLQIFEKAAETEQNAVLLLIGTGPDFEKIRALVDIHPYKNKIILYGETNEIRAMYSAMDVFVLPSKYEGLPVVLLEAQINGLPCVVSDKVTKEVDFGDICWESIEADPKDWAVESLKVKTRKKYEREDYYKIHRTLIDRFDIIKTVKQLEGIYSTFMERNKL